MPCRRGICFGGVAAAIVRHYPDDDFVYARMGTHYSDQAKLPTTACSLFFPCLPHVCLGCPQLVCKWLRIRATLVLAPSVGRRVPS